MAKKINLKIKNTQLAKMFDLNRGDRKSPSSSQTPHGPPTVSPLKPKNLPTASPSSDADLLSATSQQEDLNPPTSQQPPLHEMMVPSPAASEHIEQDHPQEQPNKCDTPPPADADPSSASINKSAATLEKPSPTIDQDLRTKERERTEKPKKNPAYSSQRYRFDAEGHQRRPRRDTFSFRRRRKTHAQHRTPATKVIRPTSLSVRLPISIKALAQMMKLKASELISKLFLQGLPLTLNDYLDDETTVQLLGSEFDCQITIDTSEEDRLRITRKNIEEEIVTTDSAHLVTRPPVIAFMGHVDHGKTSLIDAIRKSNLAGAESGAITQHIGAFRCHRKEGDLTILDTPGHEAFSMMRKRGAAITDIVVLVVAGDEGIMPQTEEAMQQAREANVPILVAINKCDKPAFDADNIYRQLADRDALPEAWGGQIVTVNCSATTGKEIPHLLEMLLIQAELLELKANPQARARGTVIEAQMHKGLGAIATILVQNGTLHLGDSLVIDRVYARVKTMTDEHGRMVEQATPATPVKITGLSDVPNVGCDFICTPDEKEARKLCEGRIAGMKRSHHFRRSNESLEHIIQRHQELTEKKILNLIIRADVQGSVEAIKNSLLNIPNKKVELVFVSEGVGEISESDLRLAEASDAAIIGFHTRMEPRLEILSRQHSVKVRLGRVIYEVIDAVKELMLGTLDDVRHESEAGLFEVKKIFKVSSMGSIAGGLVLQGTVHKNHYAKLYRGENLIWSGKIVSLKRVKDDVKEVSKGLECGLALERFNQVEEGDLIRTFTVSYVKQEL